MITGHMMSPSFYLPIHFIFLPNCFSQLIPRECSPGQIVYGGTFLLHIINRNIFTIIGRFVHCSHYFLQATQSTVVGQKSSLQSVIEVNFLPTRPFRNALTLTIQMHTQHETLCHLQVHSSP